MIFQKKKKKKKKIDAKKLGIVFVLPRELTFLYENELGVDFGTYETSIQFDEEDPIGPGVESGDDVEGAGESSSRPVMGRRSSGNYTQAKITSDPPELGTSSSAVPPTISALGRRQSFFQRKMSDAEQSLESLDHDLPLPVTLVVSRNGIVKYAFVNTDFTIRAPIQEILNTLDDIAVSES